MTEKTCPRHVGPAVALVSVCLIATELTLTRLFSVIIWYHFAFLAISVALFGMGTAALLVHLAQHRLPPERTGRFLAIGCAVLSAVIILATVALLRMRPDVLTGATGVVSPSTAMLTVIFIAAAAPFFAGGFVVSLAMTRYVRHVHSLYFFDLVGAGTGCLLLIPALNALGAPLALVAAAIVAAAAGFVFAIGGGDGKRVALVPAGAFAIALLLGITSPWTGLFAVGFAKGYDLRRIKVEYNRWNSFSMITVLDLDTFLGWGVSPMSLGPRPEQKTLVIDMNALTPLTRFNGDPKSVPLVSDDCTSLVYRVRPNARDVCVIGAGGGRDVLAALASGARHVTAVEINPLIVEDVMRGRFRDFVGRLYDRPDVTPVVDDGRSFVRSSDRFFDVVQLSMVDTSAATAAGAYSLTENSLYTVEAFRDYLDRLAPGGVLSVSSVSVAGLATGARLASLARAAVESTGGDPTRSVAVVRTPWRSSVKGMLHNVLVKRGAFTEKEMTVLGETVARLGFQPVYMAGAATRAQDPRSQWITDILGSRDSADLRLRMEGWPLDVSPTTDNRPFFFYQSRLRDLLSGKAGADGPQLLFRSSLFVLSRVAAIAVVMVILFLAIPMFFGARQIRGGSGSVAADLGYVACLGMGFMLVEIGMIQKLSLYLGRPTHTLAVVLLCLLVSGGLGSRLAGAGHPGTRRRRLAATLAILVCFLGVVWLSGLGHAILDATVAWPIWARSCLAGGLLVPLGLVLGGPFPTGLSAVAERAPSRIPWLWSVNSATSVLGSVLATLVSLHAGITATLWVGTAIYALALVFGLRVTASRAPD
ncbi:MAG: hypothetical protein PHU25_15450 [Deltaproteobacteria bacterium]|nr:hypothetical protein [Deltaproteobacteria bacterium]